MEGVFYSKANSSQMSTREEQDLAAWLPVAEAVRKGKYKSADDSTKESLMIGLRGLDNMACKQAVMVLEDYKENKKVK